MQPYTKSRNGCSECKARRIKCDEARPACSSCVKKKIICPGYKKDLQWMHWDGQIEQTGRTREESPLTPSTDATMVSSRRLDPAITRRSKTAAEIPQKLKSTGGLRFGIKKPSWAVPPDPSRILRHEPTYLVEYYFGHICRLLSAFDGAKNPFRTALYDIWPKSSLIHASMQSLSAASLAKSGFLTPNDSFKAQQEAFRHLRQKLQMPDISKRSSLDEVLLSLLLIGLTTSWHAPDDFGSAHYRMAVSLLKQKLDLPSAGAFGIAVKITLHIFWLIGNLVDRALAHDSVEVGRD